MDGYFLCHQFNLLLSLSPQQTNSKSIKFAAKKYSIWLEKRAHRHLIHFLSFVLSRRATVEGDDDDDDGCLLAENDP